MKKLILTLLAGFVMTQTYGQIKLGILKNDSVICCRTIKGTTLKNEIVNVPVIYTAQFRVDTISGYQKFVWSIIGSTDRETWFPILSDTVTEDKNDWTDGHWDTLIMETDAIVIPNLGLQIETIDSTQSSKHKHDLIITTPTISLPARNF